MMTSEDIIERIIYFRKRAKLTQRELSNLIKMNQSYINRLESQKDFLPSVAVLLNIIDACTSTPEEFFSKDYQHYSDSCYDKDRLRDKLKGFVEQLYSICKEI